MRPRLLGKRASGWHALVAMLMAGMMVLAISGTAAAASLPVGNFATGVATEFTNPGGNPPGSDIWTCRPSTAHPYPVILVHGTLANENFSWQALSPMLANAGYCVYAFNYGADASTFGHLYGLADIAQSAQQLADFTRLVLASDRCRPGRHGGPLTGRHDAALLHAVPGRRAISAHAGRSGAVQPGDHGRRGRHAGLACSATSACPS